jgi:hypothetical protein
MVPSDIKTGPGRSIRRFIADFAAALVLFAIVAGAFSVPSSNAFPAPPPAELVGPAFHTLTSSAVLPVLLVEQPNFASLAGPPPRGSLLTLLALAFATLTAMNMAVWRHLRTAYASPRRRSWRRD